MSETKSTREIYAEKKRAASEQFLTNCPVQEGEKLYTVDTPIFGEWQCRRPNLKLFLDAGLLPAGLSTKLFIASKQSKEEQDQTVREMTSREAAQAIEFNSAMLRYICVNPRIVENPQEDDEISFDDVSQGDYTALTEWAKTGGVEAAGLENFPGGRHTSTAARLARKGNGKARKRKAKDPGRTVSPGL